jgi:hypothetical protein
MTNVNGAFFDEVAVSTPAHFTFIGLRGQHVDSWIMRPVPTNPSGRYPLILATHRGALAGVLPRISDAGGPWVRCGVLQSRRRAGLRQDYAPGQDQDRGGATCRRCFDAWTPSPSSTLSIRGESVPRSEARAATTRTGSLLRPGGLRRAFRGWHLELDEHVRDIRHHVSVCGLRDGRRALGQPGAVSADVT